MHNEAHYAPDNIVGLVFLAFVAVVAICAFLSATKGKRF